MSQMIPRPGYLQTLLSWKDKADIIKIVTGIRRSGKSALLDIYQIWLNQNGVKPEHIIRVDYEEAGPLSDLMDWKKLYEHIKSQLKTGQMNYIFLDEIQVVPEFQLAVNALRKLPFVDIYLTGSNSAILSGELASRLAGRFITINMLPLSFKEYVSAYPFTNRTTEEKFNDYIRNGGFPYSMRMLVADEGRENWDLGAIRMLNSGIWNTIVMKDLIERKKIREVERLNNVIKFLFHNIGNETSISGIANAITESGMKIDGTTIESWLNGLLDAFVLYKAHRYDVKGKRLLKTNAKYFVSDVGLRYYLLGGEGDFGHILENVVYLELRRRGYDDIFIGKVNNNEVDFVAKRGADLEYFQVAYSMSDKKTEEREFSSLNAINDHNPKFILTHDRLFRESNNGIKTLNVLDWLLNGES